MTSSRTEIVEETADILSEYGRIPTSFEVHSVFLVELVERGLKGLRLSEHPVAHPWVKDYDATQGEGPLGWADQWDISKWGVISAVAGGTRVGGCVIAHDTPGVHKLEGRRDIAAIWDMRVAPQWRGNGIGSLLIESAVAWAIRRHCRILKAETQNINVPACRFYAKHGLTLAAINRCAYPELPDEVEMVWSREL
jgi:GNAT superfamily N-acetyltransferase